MDSLTKIESKVIGYGHNLIDTLVSFETISLYNNLSFIGSRKYQLFGMHDATAYGINRDGTNWSDDGSATKSDIKELTGSHGAISSYDADQIVSKTFSYHFLFVASFTTGCN